MHGFDRNEAGKMFVGGLSWDTTKDSLLGYFSQYGEVIDCVVMKSNETGKSRGFGFVTYRDPHCVETVLSHPAHIVDGRQVDPKACNPKGSNRGGGGGGASGGGGGRMGGGPQGVMMDRGFQGETPPPRMNRGPPQGDIKDRKIFIGGLPNNADEESIKNFFSRYGNVVDVTVMYDPQKQRSRALMKYKKANEPGSGKTSLIAFETAMFQDQHVPKSSLIRINAALLQLPQVECKMATPRNRRMEDQQSQPGPPPMGHMGQPEEPQPLMNQVPPPPQSHLPPEIGGQPPQGPPPPFQVQEASWGPPPPEPWSPPTQGPPPPIGAPPQFPPNLQFPGYQGDQPPPLQPPTWSQPPPPAPAPGAWPPGAVPPPTQPQAAVSPPFLTASSVSQSFSSAPVYQQPLATAIYQWSTAPPPTQPPPAPNNGQPPPTSVLGQSPQSGYSYSTAAYGSHPVTSPPAAVPPRSYQDFSNGQAQITTSIAPVQPPTVPPPVSSTQTFASYTSPYATPAPPQVASAQPADPYAQAGVPAPPPAGAIQVPAASTPAPATLQGYGSAISQAPLATSPDPAAASKATVDYSAYYSAYGGVGSQYQTDSATSYSVGGNPAPHLGSAVPGALPQGGASYTAQSQAQTAAVTGYGAEATQNAAAAAYSTQPAPAPSLYGGQGDAQQAVAYGAPGPAPSFQRQGAGSQGYHPYARR